MNKTRRNCEWNIDLEAKLEEEEEEEKEEGEEGQSTENVQKQHRCIKQMGKLTKVDD